MIYSEFKNLKLSMLGYGCMRFPVIGGNQHAIDEAEAIKLLQHAYDNGVNYFDTAYFYHAGNSETVLGKALAKYPRDSFYLADKMPGQFMEAKNGKLAMDMSSMGIKNVEHETARDVFEHQLEKLGVDYIDFYMLHNVGEFTYNLYTDENIAMVDYLLEEKKAGRIRHLGFSAHGWPDTLESFLDRYDCFEFVMIQLNYLDWKLQEAEKKYEIITNRNLPVFVMEPVRGGKLANPGKDAEALLRAASPDDKPVKWAFRFLQSLPNVKVIISGMSAIEHVKENLTIFEKPNPLTDADKDVLADAVEAMAEFVPCTSCRYCCDTCPQELNIPMLINLYNEAMNTAEWWYTSDVLKSLSDSERPEACINCGACTAHCPQNIEIAGIMEKFTALIKSKQ